MKTVISALVTDTGDDDEETFILFRKEGHWIFVGGKPDEGEDEIRCLKREIIEETNGMIVEIDEYIDQFDGISPINNERFRMLLYHGVYVKGPTTVKPGCELEESGRFTFEEAMELNLSQVTRDALNHWKESQNE